MGVLNRCIGAVLLLAACRVEVGGRAPTAETAGAEVWVYTSMYQEVLDAMAAQVREELPGITITFFQAGSEKVAQRWEAESAAGASKACVLATSDPGWYQKLSDDGKLRPYVSPRALDAPRDWVFRDRAPMRVSLMVLAGPGPDRFAALSEPAWKDRFSTGDPLASGTTFTALAAWEGAYGWAWVEAVRANGWIAAGGNSAVMARMESGERPVGIVLLENLLAKPGVAEVTWPADGAVAIPGMVAIPADCPAPEAAERVVDWLLGDTAQAAIVAGHMHSPFPGIPAPTGIPPLAAIQTFPEPVNVDSAALKSRWESLR